MSRTLYLVLSGASAPEGTAELVRALQDRHWRVTVLSTPTGVRFHDQGRLEELTGEAAASTSVGPVRARASPCRRSRGSPCGEFSR